MITTITYHWQHFHLTDHSSFKLKEVSVRLTDCQRKLSPKKVMTLGTNDQLWGMPAEDIHADSGWFQEEQKRALPESPGKSMLMKFIDCSGTDITEKVKEVNDKEYEKVKEIEKMKEETERKFEQVNENQKDLEKVEELNEKGLEARLKEDFFIPAEEETDESSTDVKEQDVGTEIVEVEKEVLEEAEDVVEVVKEVVEVVPEPPVEADLEVLEISHPKVQEVLIVLDEDEDKASGFDCILEKVDSSPEKIEPAISELAGQGQIIAVQGSVEERHPSAMPSVARSFEEEFSKFTKKKVLQAESEVDSDSGQKELEGNFSADDENDEESGAENGLVVNSPAWSSLSLILEPQACLLTSSFSLSSSKSSTTSFNH